MSAHLQCGRRGRSRPWQPPSCAAAAIPKLRPVSAVVSRARSQRPGATRRKPDALRTAALLAPTPSERQANEGFAVQNEAWRSMRSDEKAGRLIHVSGQFEVAPLRTRSPELSGKYA